MKGAESTRDYSYNNGLIWSRERCSSSGIHSDGGATYTIDRGATYPADGGATLTTPPEAMDCLEEMGFMEEMDCCPDYTGPDGHRDSYDPRLDTVHIGEERSREQGQAEQLLKRFNMYRWVT